MSTIPPAPPAPSKEKTNTLAIVGFALALAPIVLIFIPFLSCLAFLCPVAAIVLGIIALTQISKSGVFQKGKGLAIAAIVIGAVWFLLIPILVITGLTIFGPNISNIFTNIIQSIETPTY